MTGAAAVPEALMSVIYEAALEPEIWPDLFTRISGALGAGMSGLVVRGADETAAVGTASAGADPAVTAAYEAQYARLDPILPSLMSKPANRVFPDSGLVDRASYVRSTFYNEWARPSGYDHGLMVRLDSGNKLPIGVLAMVVVTRPASRPAFSADEASLLSRLAPHLGRAVALRQQLARAGAAHIGGLALDHLRLPAAVTDEAGRLVWANRAAEALLHGTLVTLGREGVLCAGPAVPRATLALRRLVAAAALGEGGALALGPAEAGAALAVLATPLSCRGAAGTRLDQILAPAPARCVLLLFVAAEGIGAERATAALRARLRNLYGLTAAEAAMALLLARGEGVPAAAEALGIGRETARTHAARVLHKTGAGRQAALARHIASLDLLEER